MGGASDLPQRSSSPLKRRASDLEAEVPSSEKEDVDMIQVSPSEPDTTESTPQSTRSKRAQSVDMLKEESEPEVESLADEVTSPKTNTEGIPPIDTQIKIVTAFCKEAAEKQLKEGDHAYLVSRAWLSRVLSRGSEAKLNSKVEPEGEVGPIDNSDIIQQRLKDCEGDEFVQLKRGLGSESFELFPQSAWECVAGWYGLMPGSIPIVRYAHNTNADKYGIPNIIYEYHPPIFKVYRLYNENTNALVSQKLKATNPEAPIFVASRSQNYMEFLKKIKTKAGIDLSKKVRVWRVPRAQPAAEPTAPIVNITTPPSSRPGSPAPPGDVTGPSPREPQDSWTQLLLDVGIFTKLERDTERELIDVTDQTGNQNYNGKTDLGFSGLGDDQAIVLDELIDTTTYVSNYTPKKTGTTAVRGSTSYIAPSSQTNSGRNSPAPYNTRGRAQKAAGNRVAGTVGLSNLGNTCYMNSALQCVRSVEELTKYFLTGVAEDELNAENPLGNNGHVALAYGNLLREMYKESAISSVQPRAFKNTIGKYAPSFSGYGQQDSQEFLGFLLDGLQEDLSRVKKKPYIEKPDSTDEMVNNPEAIKEMAAKVWDITKKRDDSVIADLFTGMYKSTLVCPVCAKVSITFDPFNNVTLQLPIENTWSHDVYFFPLNDKPIIITVDMDKQGSIGTMKQYMSRKTGVPTERLFVAEEFKNKFYKIHDDWEQASDVISNNDNVTIYEVESKPTNWPAPKKTVKKQKTKSHLSFGNKYGNDSEEEEEVPSWDGPLAERLLVPVFHRRPNPAKGRFNKAWIFAPMPHVIILTPAEARNEEIIRRKILEKVATFSTHPIFKENEDADASTTDSIDPDIVLANGSDSSGEGKVVASSVDGEDGIVDITMNESADAGETNEEETAKSPEPSSKLTLNQRRPKFMEPGAFIYPELQNLFTMGYFQGVPKETVPTGWTAVDEEKSFPTLASRNPQLHQMVEDESSTEFDMTSARAGSESSNEDNSNQYSSTTRMNEESDEDEAAPSPVIPNRRDLPVRPAKSVVRVGPKQKRNNRRIKTYSKKGNKPAQKSKSPSIIESDPDQDAPDDGPLVRLGEGIVVDWNNEAFEHMFEGDRDDPMRGSTTTTSMSHYEDQELLAIRKARITKRKNGITLDDCLNEFGKEEVLSEQDTWYCPRCKEHRRATKKFELWKTPDILVMHLKRFSSSSYRRDKLDVLVDFPIEGLDLTSRVLETEDGKSEIYDLIAVDDHWGGLGGGHYTAFAKNFVDNKWYEYNDSSVSLTKDVSRIVTSSAYLLFYRRRSEAPLGGPRFQQILNNYEHVESSEDDNIAESGEDQSLVANSSLHGSSSALIGVGAAHRQENGSSSENQQMTTVNPQDLDAPPPYQTHEENEPENESLLPSVEDEDEGIGMDYNGPSYGSLTNVGISSALTSNQWNSLNWNGLNASKNNNFVSGTASEIDGNSPADADELEYGSDDVNEGSEIGSDTRRERIDDFNSAIVDDSEYEENPVPDIDDPNQLDTLDLQRDILIQAANRGVRPEFKVEVQETDEIEEPATEIHVEEGEGIKPLA